MSDPQAVAAARAANSNPTNPAGPGGPQATPGGGGPPMDIHALRAKLQSGEITPDQVMQMVQQGRLPVNIVEQLGFNKRPDASNGKQPQNNVPPQNAQPSNNARPSSPPRQPDPAPPPRNPGGKSQPRGNISNARHVMRTRVRRFLIKSFGTICTINSVITTTYCFTKLEETWRGVPGSWSWIGITLGLIVGVWLWLWQLSLSDWDSLGVVIGYFVVLTPDVYMTTLPWYSGIMLPLLSNSMADPTAAVPVAFGISLVWALISSKASDWAFLGRPALSLLERIAGRG